MIRLITVVICLWHVVMCMGRDAIQVSSGGFIPSVSATLAMQDLRTYLKPVSDAGKWRFRLCLDKRMKDGSFAYVKEKRLVKLVGADEIGITHAVYTLLEDLGYTFDFTGVSVKSHIGTIAGLSSRRITPKIRWRGIRQHVNFPMDISSYKIEEAKDYVESLLRMRFNKLTVHSYPGQWYETCFGDSLALAGYFFYGDVHYMYNNRFLKRSVPENDSIYCIPGAEQIFCDLSRRSRFAINWMQELIRYAKELGFYVQFSFEPRNASVSQAVATAEEIRNTYPQIDALEMITEETGGWGSSCTEREVRETLARYFAPEVAVDTTVTNPIRPKQSDLNTLYGQIGVIAGAIHVLQAKGGFGPELKLGIYCSVTGYTSGAYRLARLALPKTKVCLMPSHGSDGTAREVASVLRSPEDMRMTELYSWIEFDGLMYLYQNSIKGNERLLSHIEQVLPGEPYGSLLYNHWRTAENRTSARYVAESTIRGSIPSDVFYQSYADRLQIDEWEKLRDALELVGKADSYAKIHLGNIGFCWMGAWRRGGSFSWMKKEAIQTVRAYYYKAGEILSRLIASADKQSCAYNYLSFVGNRVLCSVLYLDAFAEAADIQLVKKEADGQISESEQARAREICNRALLIFDQYMQVHAQMMPDRGCKGTLVSIWNAPIKGLKIYRSNLGGVALNELPHSDTSVDAPPLPIFYGEAVRE